MLFPCFVMSCFFLSLSSFVLVVKLFRLLFIAFVFHYSNDLLMQLSWRVFHLEFLISFSFNPIFIYFRNIVKLIQFKWMNFRFEHDEEIRLHFVVARVETISYSLFDIQVWLTTYFWENDIKPVGLSSFTLYIAARANAVVVTSSGMAFWMLMNSVKTFRRRHPWLDSQ